MNCLPVVELTLARGKPENLMARSSKGHVPFHWACQGGDMEVIRFLIKRGGDWQIKDEIIRKALPIHLACSNGNLEAVEYLCGEMEKSLLSKKDVDGETILHQACLANIAEIVTLIVEKSSPLMLIELDNYGDLPIHRACRRGNLNCVRACFELMNEHQLSFAPLQEGKMWTRTLEEGSLPVVMYLLDEADKQGTIPKIRDFFMGEKVLLKSILEDQSGQQPECLAAMMRAGIFLEDDLEETCLPTQLEAVKTIYRTTMKKGAHVVGMKRPREEFEAGHAPLNPLQH